MRSFLAPGLAIYLVLALIPQSATGTQSVPTATPMTLAADFAFEPGSTALSPASMAKLDSLVRSLGRMKLQVVIVVASITPTGNSTDDELAQRKMMSGIKDYLVGHGVEGNRIYTEGKFSPAADGKAVRKVELEAVGTALAEMPVTTHGVIQFPGGVRYEGDILNGNVAQGKGTMTYATGDRYEGEFVNGQITGRGIFTYVSGNRYEGDWVNGHRSGKGIYTYANGNRYEGDFLNGQQSGKGIMTFANGDRYEGDWVNSQITGKGILTYANGNRLVGDFANGQSTNGTEYLGNGTIVATYVNGQKQLAQQTQQSLAGIRTPGQNEGSSAAPAQSAVGGYGSNPGNWITTEGGCKFLSPFGIAGRRISWNGSCQDGKVTGNGSITAPSSLGTMSFEGNFANGKLITGSQSLDGRVANYFEHGVYQTQPWVQEAANQAQEDAQAMREQQNSEMVQAVGQTLQQRQAQNAAQQQAAQNAEQQRQLRLQQQQAAQHKGQTTQLAQREVQAQKPTQTAPPPKQIVASNTPTVSQGKGPHADQSYDRSNCISIFLTGSNNDQRFIRNSCPIKLDIAFCGVGPVQDITSCTPTNGVVGVAYANSTMGLGPNQTGSNTYVVPNRNQIAYFACDNSDGLTSAYLTSYNPPQGKCWRTQ